MNVHLKILLYIGLVVGIFYFVQNKYSLFDISFNNFKDIKLVEQVKEEREDGNTLEIINNDKRSIIVQVEIANNPDLRSSGLAGRSQLGDYQGMIFIFDKEDRYSFWMYDMLIPLDIIYIDSRGVIVDILKNQLPCSDQDCPSIVSPKPFKYVLEVNSGFSRVNRVDIGNEVIFNISSED